jgi:hypothetical protein
VAIVLTTTVVLSTNQIRLDYTQTGTGLTSPVETIAPNVWHYIVGRRQGTTFSIFYDGTDIADVTDSTPLTATSMPLLIGKRNDQDGRDCAVDGRMDEVAIWNRALDASDLATIYNKGAGLPLSPGAFVVSFPSTTTAGAAQTLTVTVQKADGTTNTGYTGTVHFTSTDPQAVLPADYTFTTADAGVHTFSATLKTAGTVTITATDSTNGITGNTTANVTPAAASMFTLTNFPATTTAGIAHNVTGTAYDPYSNLVTGYLGTIHFTSTDPQAVLPSDYTFAAADAGVHTFAATLKTAGTMTLLATDTTTSSITGSATATVNAASLAQLGVTGFPNSTTAGVAQTFVVTAEDAYGNSTGVYSGTVHFTSSDPQAILPANYTFAAADAGTHTFSATLKTAGTMSLTATDRFHNTITGTQGGITVLPAAPSGLSIDGLSPTPTAGAAQTFTVSARDLYGNVAPGYLGTVHFTSTDPKGVLPADYTFTSAAAGQHTFSGLALQTAGAQTLTVTDTVTATFTANKSVTVQAAAATHFTVVVSPTTITAGQGVGVVVTALDAFGNRATGYTGTVQFSSTDKQAVLPLPFTFPAAANGQDGFLGISLRTAGMQTLTVTDTANAMLSASAVVKVMPAAANHLGLGVPAAVTAGVPFSITVFAKDPYGNIDPSYRGTVHFTSTDTFAHTVLPADYTFTSADAGKHTLTATLTQAGVRTLHAADTVNTALVGNVALTVKPAATNHLGLGIPTTVTAGTAFSITVFAKDQYGNLATGYRGTVHFGSSDKLATLPANYVFTAADAGQHTFSGAVLRTTGRQTVTIMDTVATTIAGAVAVSVQTGAGISAEGSPLPGRSLPTSLDLAVVAALPQGRTATAEGLRDDYFAVIESQQSTALVRHSAMVPDALLLEGARRLRGKNWDDAVL